MSNEWKSIWDKKALVSFDDDSKTEFEKFSHMKKINGFDVAVENESSYYEQFYNEWISFYNTIMEITHGDINSVYEVGCGSGVNLYMFKQRLDCIVGGADYSQAMVTSAQSVTGSKDIKCCGANEIEVSPKYDLVMAESVFQYFESIQYAKNVLCMMIEKSNKVVYLGEVHDKQYEEELMEYRRKTIKDYDEKYKGLSKMFYDKEWLESIASSYGKKIKYTYFDNKEYINGKYIFNCYIY